MTASATTGASIRSLARSRGLRRNSPKAGHCGRRIVKISKASSAVAWVLIGRSCGRRTVIEIPSGRVALQTEGLVVGVWRTGGAPAAGLGAQTVSTRGAWTPGSRLGGGGPARLARAATIDRGSAVRRPSRPPPLAPFGFNFHGGGDCWPGACPRRTTMPPRFVAFRQPETVGRCRWPPVRSSWPAAFLGSSVADWRSRPSWAVGNAGVLDLALFRAEDTYQYGLVGGRVSTRSTDGVGRRSSSSQRDLQPPSLYATGPRADTRQWPSRRGSPARPGRGRR